ncbi:Delta-sarcoglycan [Sarcoptes scabiei]|uniref:Delta-sarcoglycan n=2 Tax=Sarcoptes scabiei TaxID=52283 RepID=A0A834RE48_SARSC|nr:Delta-sarcoglycan [Sarcoptes scabiei]
MISIKSNQSHSSSSIDDSLMFQNYPAPPLLESQLDDDLDEMIASTRNGNFPSPIKNDEQDAILALMDNDPLLILDPTLNGANLIRSSSIEKTLNPIGIETNEIGIYGWRKNMIFILLLFNIFLMALNLGLIFWIISVLRLTSYGFGGIEFSKISSESIQMKNSVLIKKFLFAKEIRSEDPNQFLTIQSLNNDLILQSNQQFHNEPFDNTHRSNQIILSNDKITMKTNRFEIYNNEDKVIFGLNSNNNDLVENLNESQSYLTLRVNGIKFDDINRLSLPITLQTTEIINSINDELRIFSPQGQLLLRGPESMLLESKLGDGSIVTFEDLKLKSNGGKIILDSDSIELKSLKIISNESNDQSKRNGSNTRMIDRWIIKPEIYQLCICSQSNRLFLAKPDSICQIESYRDCI